MANEKRLIDVSKLIKPPYAEDDNITGCGMTYDEMCGYNDGIDAVWSMIQHRVPTVDAVEVVRCKDCKYMQYSYYGKQKYAVCEHNDWYVDLDNPFTEEDGFCFRGERRCE